MPDWIKGRPFAHRGLFGPGVPENSLAAVGRAADLGFPVEIDVQASRDGRVVVFHDWKLDRLTGAAGRMDAADFADLRRLRLQGTNEGIPLLEEVLELVNGRVAILVEIKNRRYVGKIEPGVAAALTAYNGSVAVQSFNPYTLGWFRIKYPHIRRGQLSCAFDTDDMAGWKKVILSVYGMNWMTRPNFLSHQWQRLPTPATTFLHRVMGLPLLAWTAKSPAELERALQLADNAIFEGFLPEPHG